MIRTEDQQTFLSYGELFSRSAQRCLAAEKSIREHIPQLQEPYSQAAELVAEAEHRLATDLTEFASKSPDNIVCTRVQYKLDETPPPAPQTVADAMANLTQVNEQLATMLLDQADKTELDTLRDTLETLHQEIEATNKRISMIRITAEDI